jgi:hypothetical protein
MTPLAVVKTDRRTEGAPRFAPNHRHRGSHDRPLAANKCAPASEALAENDAKDRKADSYAIPSRILKPNIYYKPHNFAREPIGSELSRLPPRQFPARSDGDVALPERAARAGFSLKKPGAGMVEDGSCEG